VDNEKIQKEIAREIRIKKVSTMIGSDALFRGVFVVEGAIRIDGKYDGNIRTRDMVIIGDGGRVKGDIYGDTVIIGGGVKGNIYAMKEIILLDTAKVLGDLTATRILIDEGAKFRGKFKKTSEENLKPIFEREVDAFVKSEKSSWEW